MNETSVTLLPPHQPHQDHESPSQTKISPCPPRHLSTQSKGMDCTTSLMPSSSQHSSSYVEFVFSKSSSSVSVYPSYLSPILTPISYARTRRERATRRAARRSARRVLRLEARLTPSEIVTHTQRRLEHQQMKERETALLKEACIKSELKRAKRTITSTNTFQTIDIHNDSDENSECEQIIITQDTEIGPEAKTTTTEAFAGLIKIQDRLPAMSQALSEHAEDGTLRKEPGRYSFHVDAAVSRAEGITGIAVVHKTHRQYWTSLWTAKGYRIFETLDQNDAETWAIWQALQLTLEKVHADRANSKQPDPCSVAVVYSDCAGALQGIRNGSSDGKKVVRKIIAQSMELQQFGVEVHLHWVPGHRNIPGNELADLVAKKARQPAK